jgi:hypothetical protein
MRTMIELSATELDLVSGGAGSTSVSFTNTSTGARNASTTSTLELRTNQTESFASGTFEGAADV